MYGEAPPPAPVYEPAYNAEGEYVDASDRESVRSAREDYEEALEARTMHVQEANQRSSIHLSGPPPDRRLAALGGSCCGA